MSSPRPTASSASDGWHRETVESTCVYTKRNGERFEAVYIAKVRIRVEADGHTIVREGTGTGEADTLTPGQAHDHALKTAETDCHQARPDDLRQPVRPVALCRQRKDQRPAPIPEPPAPQAADSAAKPAGPKATSAREPENPEIKPNGKIEQNLKPRRARPPGPETTNRPSPCPNRSACVIPTT